MGPHPYDGIIQHPLARLRQKAASSFRHGRIERDFKGIADGLEAILTKNNPAALDDFRVQRHQAESAIMTGEFLDEPRVRTPELQLLWGMTLGARLLKADEETDRFGEPVPVIENPLWKAILADDTLEEERRFCAQVISSIPGLRERQGSLKVEWGAPLRGYPEMGFYCDPNTGTVNLDLAWTLIMGLEPARSLMLREAANGLGTLYFTEDMSQVRSEMAAIKAQAFRTEEQHKHMIHLAAQWLARFDVTVEAENNFASRFAADRAKISAQDYAASLNYAETVAGGIPEAAAFARAAVKPPVPVKAKFANLLRALHYAFFRNNGLFEGTDEGWRSVGVRPEWIETADGAKKGLPALEELAGFCKQMEDLQPSLRDRGASDTFHARKMEECSRERGRIADKIFARFAQQMIPELEAEADKNPQEVMDRLEQMTGEKKDGQKQDGERGEPGEPGEDGEEGEPSDEDTANVEDKGKTRDARLPPKDPREAKGLPQDGEPQPGEGEGEGEEADGDGMDGEGEGDGDGDGDGQDADGDGEGLGDGDGDGEEKDSEARDDLKEVDEPQEGEGGREHGQTSSDGTPDFEKDGSFNEYQRIIGPYSDIIAKTTDVMRLIQEKLYVTVQDPSVSNSLVPEDGDVSRFQPQALQDRLIKQFSGQSIDESDFETFRVDGPVRRIPAPTEIQIWIDGSGSMSGQPVEMAITTGCILYEAAREAGMDVYITMLGDPLPLVIAKPGMSNREIGRNIESVRAGQGGDKDYLAPTIAEMVKTTLAKKKDLGKPVGNTHAFVISDGMFTDERAALEHVKSVNDNCPHTTLDFLLINGRPGLAVERLADELNRKAKKPKVGYKEVRNYTEIQEGLMEILQQRLKTVRSEDAIPLAQKQKEFKGVKLKKDYRRGR